MESVNEHFETPLRHRVGDVAILGLLIPAMLALCGLVSFMAFGLLSYGLGWLPGHNCITYRLLGARIQVLLRLWWLCLRCSSYRITHRRFTHCGLLIGILIGRWLI